MRGKKARLRPTVNLVSLGCAKNLVDSEVMSGLLQEQGFALVDAPEKADIVIVNTCAFIQEATQEAIDHLFAAVRLKQSGRVTRVIAAGCLPQRYGRKIAGLLPEIDGFVGPGSVSRVPEAVRKVWQGTRVRFLSGTHTLYTPDTPRLLLTPRHTAYVKVADGCDNRCRYCVIPSIRGPYRSRSLRSIVAEVQQLVMQGVKEFNLISQDTTFYGKDRSGAAGLERLLRQLVRVAGDVRWIRILYTHPGHFRPELLDIIRQEPKICKYLDMPIQHINSRMLEKMGRNITGPQLRRRIDYIRAKAPEVALRTTLIVGFPGETQAMFNELAAFVRETRFERLGVFAYSAEEGTPAARFARQVPLSVRHRRRDRIMKIQQAIAAELQSRNVGRELDVLIDEKQNATNAIGRTQFDAPEVDGVVMVKGRHLKPGDFCRVRITGSWAYDLAGETL